jgi:hypothetical protein
VKRESACVGVIGFGEVGSRMLWKVWTEGLRNPLSLCVFWGLGKERKGREICGLSCLVTFVGEISGVREG